MVWAAIVDVSKIGFKLNILCSKYIICHLMSEFLFIPDLLFFSFVIGLLFRLFHLLYFLQAVLGSPAIASPMATMVSQTPTIVSQTSSYSARALPENMPKAPHELASNIQGSHLLQQKQQGKLLFFLVELLKTQFPLM